MKVVLFCGGQGLRMGGRHHLMPKPMVHIGGEPILVHLMRYYAHHGHRDFVLCLGHRGDKIRTFFDGHGYQQSNDLTDPGDWKITFIDSGEQATIGERLRAARSHIGADALFLANYADGLSDLDLHAHIHWAQEHDAVATMLSVPLPQPFPLIRAEACGTVSSILPVSQSGLRINGGYFVFKAEIFNWIERNEDLVEQTFHRLIDEGELSARPHDGFWQSMDTFKDQQNLEQLLDPGPAPWELWKGPQVTAC